MIGLGTSNPAKNPCGWFLSIARVAPRALTSSRKEQRWQIYLAQVLRKDHGFGEVGILKQIYRVIPIYSFETPWRVSPSIRLTSLLLKRCWHHMVTWCEYWSLGLTVWDEAELGFLVSFRITGLQNGRGQVLVPNFTAKWPKWLKRTSRAQSSVSGDGRHLSFHCRNRQMAHLGCCLG